MAYTFKYGDRPLDGYTVQRAVGRGGFGEVYYALTDSGKQVALKYLRDNAEIELRGISMVMNIKSPHLITVYDVRKSADGEPFVIMEYVSGPSLRDLLLAEPGGLGPQKTAFFLNGICKGLSYLHDRGIVHRDLKPGNIFYDDGYVKIGDYGLSKHISVSKHSGQTVSVGTVHYMAPEIGSGNYTKAIDIYALGVITYEMLTGRLPFTGSSMGEILMRHLSERPDLAGVPEPFAAIIARSLAKDPKDRYQDVNEMMHAVLNAAGVTESLSTFDPNTLTSVPRVADGGDPDRTVTGTPAVPPIPSMDVRNVGRRDDLAARIHRRAEDIAAKFQEKTNKWERRLRGQGVGRPDVPPPPMPGGIPIPAASGAPRGRLALTAIVLGAMLAVSIGLTFALRRSLRDPAEFVFVFLLFQLGATAAALLSYYYSPRGRAAAETVIDKLARAGIGALFMLPAVGVAGELRGARISPEEFQRIIIPMIAMMALCDWRKRIDAGRRGRVQGGEAWWPGIIGLVGGAIADTPTPMVPAALCATVSLAAQAAAGMWPLRRDLGAAEERAAPAPPRAGSAGDADWRRPEPPATPPTAETSADSLRRAAPPGTFVGPRVSAASGGGPEAVSGAARGLYGAAATLLLAVGLGCFFALIAMDGKPAVPNPPDPSWHDGLFAAQRWARASDQNWSEEKLNREYWLWNAGVQRAADFDVARSALLFGTLACGAWLIFAARKAFQRLRLPAWRGTLRWACVSGGLTLTAGMIAILAFQPLRGEERAATVFGLVVGSVIALVCACVPGARPAWGVQPALVRRPGLRSVLRVRLGWSRARVMGFPVHTPGAGEAETPPAPPAEAPEAAMRAAAPSFVGRTAHAGLALAGKLLLLAGVAGPLVLFSVPISVRDGDHSVSIQQGVVTVTRGDDTVVQRRVSRNVILAPIVVGGVLLVLARRLDGGAHRKRAVLGAIVTGVVAHQLMGPLNADLLRLIQTQSTAGLSDGGAWLLAAGGAQLAALALIFWPRRRASHTIVI